MKKTFLTSKNQEELATEIRNIGVRTCGLIQYKGENTICVSSGRGITYWKVNLNISGEITVERKTTFMDWLYIMVFTIIDIFLFYLCFYRGFSFTGVCIFLGFIAFEHFIIYGCYVRGPLKRIEKFINQYLDGKVLKSKG